MEKEKDILDNLELRSENVQDILTQPPHWMIRWGNTVIFVILLMVLLMSYVIKYPEFIPAPIVVTSKNPPEKLEARTNSKIEKILVKDHQSVNKNQVMMVLQSAADYKDILALKEIVDSMSSSQVLYFPTQQASTLKLGEIQGEDLKRELFTAYSEEYQRLIAPRLPAYLTDTPHFGGVSLSYTWQDCWQNPGRMTLLMKDVLKDLTPESRERPYQIFSQFRDQVITPLSRQANDLFRSMFLGSIYPILDSAGIGIPSSTELEVAFHRDAKDASDFESNVRLILGIAFNPTLPREFMAQFGHDVIRTQFRHLIYAEFGAFCQREVFPAIAQLPVDVRDLCVGLKFKLNKEFTFEE